MKQSKQLIWPKREKFTLPGLVRYFKKIEKLNETFNVKLIEQSIGFPGITVKKGCITHTRVTNSSHEKFFLLTNTNSKIECGMCVGAHVHYLSASYIDNEKKDETPSQLDYQDGVWYLFRLIFGKTPHKLGYHSLNRLISRCFKTLTTLEQRRTYTRNSEGYTFRDVCNKPFDTYDWPVNPSLVFQHLIDNPQLIAEIKS